MKPTPFLSVIVTTHRRPRLLARCLDSLLGQEGEDPFEIVVVADESSAGTREQVAGQLREGDAFLSLPGLRGPAATRNVGVQVARGDWICFLDDDDTFAPRYFLSAMPFLHTDRARLHYGNYEKLTEDRDAPGLPCAKREHIRLATFARPLSVMNSIPNNAYFVPRLVAQGCRVDESLHSHEDWDYLLALHDRLPFKYHDLDGPRVHTALQTSRNNAAFSDGSVVLDFLSIYRRWPAQDAAVQEARRDFLATLGLQLPAAFL